MQILVSYIIIINSHYIICFIYFTLKNMPTLGPYKPHLGSHNFFNLIHYHAHTPEAMKLFSLYAKTKFSSIRQIRSEIYVLTHPDPGAFCVRAFISLGYL